MLTTIECVTGMRKWQNTLTYCVMSTGDANIGDGEANEGNVTRQQCGVQHNMTQKDQQQMKYI